MFVCEYNKHSMYYALGDLGVLTDWFDISDYSTLFCSWKFLLNSARSHWLLRGHMTSNNETVSR